MGNCMRLQQNNLKRNTESLDTDYSETQNVETEYEIERIDTSFRKIIELELLSSDDEDEIYEESISTNNSLR